MRKFTSIHGKTLSYLDEGEGFPILFGHSYLWNAEMWRPQIDVLKKNYRCIVPDLWGHGESGTITDDVYSIDAIADDYQSLLQQLNIGKVALVGLSVGGMWTTQIALNNPDSVAALVIMDTYVGPEPDEKLQGYLDLINEFVAAEKFQPDFIDRIKPFYFTSESIQNNLPIVHGFSDDLANIPSENVNTIAAIGRGIFHRENLLPKLSQLNMPSLVTVGDKDLPRPPSEAQEMAKLMNCDCVIVENAAHIANVEQPDIVTEQLQRFLEINV